MKERHICICLYLCLCVSVFPWLSVSLALALQARIQKVVQEGAWFSEQNFFGIRNKTFPTKEQSYWLRNKTIDFGTKLFEGRKNRSGFTHLYWNSEKMLLNTDTNFSKLKQNKRKMMVAQVGAVVDWDFYEVKKVLGTKRTFKV